MNHAALDPSLRLAFIGAGNMAAALIGGLLKSGIGARQMVAADPSPAALRRLADATGIAAARDNQAAVRVADVVLLAVKPQHLHAVAQEIAPHVASRALLISIAAGIPHAALSRWFGEQASIVRTMPNRPALRGQGATALYAPVALGAAQRDLAQSIMAAVGTTVWVQQESQMDTVTALSGSGPAYFFLFMEALQSAAQARGLPADVARQLTLQTALGAALMAIESHDSLATLREQVTSTGGTTAAALEILDAAGLRAIVASAIDAADQRAAELAAKYAAI